MYSTCIVIEHIFLLQRYRQFLISLLFIGFIYIIAGFFFLAQYNVCHEQLSVYKYINTE